MEFGYGFVGMYWDAKSSFEADKTEVAAAEPDG